MTWTGQLCALQHMLSRTRGALRTRADAHVFTRPYPEEARSQRTEGDHRSTGYYRVYTYWVWQEFNEEVALKKSNLTIVHST